MRPRNILILLAILLAVGGYFYFSRVQPPASVAGPREYVYRLDDERQIQRVEIRLPREDKGQAFVKIKEEDKFPWYFDDPQRSPVDVERWGGGIPLILKGPIARKVVARDATPVKLAEFGLAQPRMEVTLTLEEGHLLTITVGDRTPDGSNDYVLFPGSNDVTLVDYLWYDVLERLVKEPPYATPSSDESF